VSPIASRTYLDHASAWPVRPEAARAHADALATAWADPGRRHAEGREAGDLLGRATATVADLVGAPERGVVWTSGGTESVHLAVLGSARAAVLRGDERRHVVVSAVEHSSVLAAVRRLVDDHGFTVTRVPVDRSGLVDPEDVAGAISPDTLAVHLQHANHEVGAVQPTHEVGAICRSRDVVLHVDACQSIGQMAVSLDQLGADLLSASAAKYGGTRGVGFLAIGPRGRTAPLQVGDERQRRRRAGLEDVPGIAAAAVALRIAASAAGAETRHRERLRRHLRAALAMLPDVEVHGPLADAHPGIVAASALYVDGEALLTELDANGFAVHSGSSCATTSGEPSHVLVAMGVLTHGHVRISIGPETTTAQLDAFVEAYHGAVQRLRATAGMMDHGPEVSVER
jgi:cysteine desulfurase